MMDRSEENIVNGISRNAAPRPPLKRLPVSGRSAIWQARLVLLVMINIAQLWILSATVEAALAGEHKHLLPLLISSAVCWLIGLTILIWWKPPTPLNRGPSTIHSNDFKSGR